MKSPFLKILRIVGCVVILLQFGNIEESYSTTYTSSAVVQQTGTVAAGAGNQAILRIAVTTTGGGTPFPICQMQFDMNNSIVPDNARLFYTATSNVFATTTQLGTTVANPTGTITFTFNQTHGSGTTYYYWLAYDIPAGAPNCSSFDASFTTNGLRYSGSGGTCPGSFMTTPSTPNPSGSRKIEGPGCWTYCTPDFPSGVYSIYNFSLNTINNASADIASGASPDHEDFTGSVVCTDLTQGITYPITVSVRGATGNNFYVNVFADWNNDGDFLDAGEEIQLGFFSTATANMPGNITVPAGATLGNTRIRIISHFSTYATPCINTGFGQSEDYCINVVSSSSPPANDDCAGAFVLNVNNLCNYSIGTTNLATASAVANPGCGGYAGGDVWYKVTVPASGHLIFDMDDNLDISDAAMAIYSGACGSLTLISCDDNSSSNGNMPMIENATLTPGATIYIRVWENGNDVSGQFSICVVDGNPPVDCTSNEDCSTAQPLTLNSITADSSSVCIADCNTGASDQFHVVLGGCPTIWAYSEVWYEITIPAGQFSMSVDLTSSDMSDMYVSYHTSDCSGIYGCYIEGSGGSLSDLFPVTPGETYIISVSSQNSGDEGNFNLCISTYAPAGSSCNNIVPVACGATMTNQTTIGYGDANNGWDCHLTGAGTVIATPGEDHYYSIDWPDAAQGGTIRLTFANVSDDINTLLDLIFLGSSCVEGVCSNSNQLDITTGLFGNGTPAAEFEVPAGIATYYFAVDAQNNNIDNYDFTVSCFGTGIQLDTINTCGSSFDAVNPNEGIYTTWDGSLAPATYDASLGNGAYGAAVTVCDNIYIRNDGWQWLKYYDMTPGSCWINIRNISHYDKDNTAIALTSASTISDAQNTSGCGATPAKTATGNWNAAYSGSVINWDFTYNVNCGSTAWGDGGDLGGPYTCGLYRFCFDADIDPLCTAEYGFINTFLLTDDGIGGTGATDAASVLGQSFPTINTNSLLPVDLLYINVECKDGFALLKWATASEINCDYYIIERSLDGNEFSKYAIIDGSGNSNQVNTYKFLDVSPYNGKSYYRLKQVDFDGKYEYFNIVYSNCISREHLIVPNPIFEGQEWEITGLLDGDKVNIIDVLGREYEYKSQSLNKGIYMIKVNNKFIDKMIVK